ncbi:isochorismatase domain-containing protein 1 isoform X1 [Xenopus laevis]|nr:isochorismatase domain-containing protein 1 isoform X1 [Xenopus laevis]XP_041438155.1 isochorismatase domain-containing protein 1 isoform X1 [Xenopus laevis]
MRQHFRVHDTQQHLVNMAEKPVCTAQVNVSCVSQSNSCISIVGSNNSNSVPVLFCFSVFARPSSVPHGSGYEVLIQKFLSLYGDQIDMHRKFVVQLFAEEWGQYIDLPKGFIISERCKIRLVPLQIQLTTLGNLTPASTVFFCCDMQERFRPAIKYFGDIISVGQRLLQGARILGIPVIVTEQYPKGLGGTVQELDLTGVKLVLPKTKFSMVLPEVEAALAELPGVRSVVLFGVETHVCIQQTALDLIGRGVEVHIVADATSSRSMMDRMFALERLARNGIIITTSEAILLQLVADKDHPKFKEIQNLIKASAPESGLLSKV